jgi:hypothetical protein
MISICYVFSSNSRNKYAGDVLLSFLNLCICSARSVALNLMYLRRTIGQLPQQIF